MLALLELFFQTIVRDDVQAARRSYMSAGLGLGRRCAQQRLPKSWYTTPSSCNLRTKDYSMHTRPYRYRRATLIFLLGAALTACQSTTRPAARETAASTAVSQPSAAASSAAAAAAPLASAAGGITTSSGLQYIEVAPGSGPAPKPGDVVSVHYTGMLTDGTVFDSSRQRNQPFQFPLGQGQVIPGWDEGIALMREGGQARLIIPPDLGYGAAGAGGVIPPNATLIFDVELVDVP